MPLVQVTIIEGRNAELRAKLMRRVTDAVEETIGAPRQSIRVILTEVPAFHWAVGGEPKGLAEDSRAKTTMTTPVRHAD